MMNEVWEPERVLEEFYKIYNEKRQKKTVDGQDVFLFSANRVEKIGMIRRYHAVHQITNRIKFKNGLL